MMVRAFVAKCIPLQRIYIKKNKRKKYKPYCTFPAKGSYRLKNKIIILKTYDEVKKHGQTKKTNR